MDLKYQARRILGKDRRSASLTAKKNDGNIARLCDRIQSQFGLQNIKHLKMKHFMRVFNELKKEGLSNTTLAG